MKVISKNHKGREIEIGELSVKRSKDEVLTVIKVYHQGRGSEEDLFIFHYNKLLKNWMLDLNKSMVSLTKKTNYRLLKEVYSKFKPTEPCNVQEFMDLLYDTHFDIFIESNKKTFKCRFTFKEFLKLMFL